MGRGNEDKGGGDNARQGKRDPRAREKAKELERARGNKGRGGTTYERTYVTSSSDSGANAMRKLGKGEWGKGEDTRGR